TAFILVCVLSFAVLGWIGVRIYQEAPPLIDKVVTTDGRVVVDSGEISAGQNVWQSLGGMEVGSVWGHGSYVAPDWTADWLHREAMFILDRWSQEEFSQPFEQLSQEQRSQLEGRLETLMRTNTHNAENNTVTIDPVRAEAFEANRDHFSAIFRDGNSDYAIPAG